MGGIETADTVTLEHARDSRLTHADSFVGRRHNFPKIEEPVGAQVLGKSQHLGIVAPELVPEAVYKANVLNFEFFGDARPFPELDA